MSSIIVNTGPANELSIAEAFLVQINYMRKVFNLIWIKVQQYSVLQTAPFKKKKVLIGSCGAGGNIWKHQVMSYKL
jgi:hypothetical protein